jgi:hypothetical protein
VNSADRDSFRVRVSRCGGCLYPGVVFERPSLLKLGVGALIVLGVPA